MTAKDRDRVKKKGEGRVTTVSFGLKIDYLWLASFQGLPTVIFWSLKVCKNGSNNWKGLE